MNRRTVIVGGVIYVLLVGAIYGTWLVRALERPRFLPLPECYEIGTPAGGIHDPRFCLPTQERTN